MGNDVHGGVLERLLRLMRLKLD